MYISQPKLGYHFISTAGSLILMLLFLASKPFLFSTSTLIPSTKPDRLSLSRNIVAFPETRWRPTVHLFSHQFPTGIIFVSDRNVGRRPVGVM